MPSGWPLGTFDRQQASLDQQKKASDKARHGVPNVANATSNACLLGKPIIAGPTPSGSVPFLGPAPGARQVGRVRAGSATATRGGNGMPILSAQNSLYEQGRVGNRKLRPYSVALGRHALFENSESLTDDFAAMRSNVILRCIPAAPRSTRCSVRR